jgi:hypothetical protein
LVLITRDGFGSWLGARRSSVGWLGGLCVTVGRRLADAQRELRLSRELQHLPYRLQRQRLGLQVLLNFLKAAHNLTVIVAFPAVVADQHATGNQNHVLFCPKGLADSFFLNVGTVADNALHDQGRPL